ncbi:hypothetical protein M8818_007465 [Zalaria obscura]|uniref:Uncharacterized protein n=1 Tax=Zalaria obscura TaxID=2024903 RepID=A0ACC3S3W0_9PEZI
MEAAPGATEPPAAESHDGPYVLRELISEVPLSADGEGGDIHITCVDAWEGNIYIGTSAAEILHFVSIPPDPSDEHGQPTYILASRTQPAYNTPQDPPGVQQILLLPQVGKACILCNGTLTFYSLPELSPAFGGKIKQSDCTWVGGLDRNQDDEFSDTSDGAVIVICLKQRLRIIRIGEQARKIRDIELGGILNIQRRDDLACVADSKSYFLLDIVNQRKIDLFPISSAAEPEPESAAAHVRDRELSPPSRPVSRSLSTRNPVRRDISRETCGHERVSSLGSAPRNTDRLRPDSPSQWPARGSSRGSVSPASERTGSPARSPVEIQQESETPTRESTPVPKVSRRTDPLRPHIVSPSPNEFLLTTGTSLDDPGVGMFVNLEGDVVRGTIEFNTYPESLVLDGPPSALAVAGGAGGGMDEGFVLAIVSRSTTGKRVKALEFQRWDTDPSDSFDSRGWLELPPDEARKPVLLRQTTTRNRMALPSISNTLSLRRLVLDEKSSEQLEADAMRDKEEDKLVERFASVGVSSLLFTGATISWVMRNPLVVRLDSQLDRGFQQTSSESGSITVFRDIVEKVFNSIRGQEPKDEFEFLTLNYIRQKASLLLLIDLILKTADGVIAFEHDKRATQEALISADIDPRVVLSLVPVLSAEVIEGAQGVWIPRGLRDIIDAFHKSCHIDSIGKEYRGAFGDNLLQVTKQYLFVWRRKKGFGSIADERQVFQTVDAALLHLLLLLDNNSPPGPATAGSLRAELNDVVDHGVDCFDRAVALLEEHRRLYVLSRLYQSRKQVSKVMATWQRILEGEPDEGGEMIDGEQDFRRYLVRIKDVNLVKQYGTWLAKRNPKLGIQIFTDDNSRVKFTPTDAVELLKAEAPGAVKEYLEHLVFGKNNIRYVNELIAFYLDAVVDKLAKSEEARSTLLQSYETYRALTPPKPTYSQFITDNAIDEEWWKSRLRLLQLIGGSHNAASQYDVEALASRLEPYSDELVPEMIILNGRRGQHVEALRLLAHGLGDYDTAIRYCLLGGSSIFNPSSSLNEVSYPSKAEQEQLFGHLLSEFMKIEDESERLERTSELLERFGGWFDVARVLSLIPDSWSVESVSGFLVHALRRLVRERNETVVVKALSSAQNLKRNVDLIEKTESFGATIIHAEDELGRA